MGIRGHYNWETAQANAVRTKRKKPGNRSVDKDVMEEAKRLLVTEQWSPEQISGALAKDGKYISHETIYRMIRKDKAEGGKLYQHCRHRLKHRARPVGGRRISIVNRTSISESLQKRDGKRFGDFEMDTIVGRGNHGAIVTLIERSTNMLFMRKLKKGKNAIELARTVIHLLSPFKGHVKSITTDNGTVTIQGAAGKSVVITNILGKVVAETVLSSDNATIAVPAGIVAVAVEGEAAVKVVVK